MPVKKMEKKKVPAVPAAVVKKAQEAKKTSYAKEQMMYRKASGSDKSAMSEKAREISRKMA